ncbi:hypothetical protein [uncultured Tateyamaria sp.]|uniref:hypothetical protein n=1 Tax=uncultured Tateyamaria sp. TaxID=455651 RepID=UPI0026205770|nr:hypothetical protein [uncultured Tateyamaria sp.]
MPIDQAEFYEHVAAILSEGDDWVTQDGQWQAPMAALATPSRSFAEVYGLSGDLLDRVADTARAQGDHGLEQAARACADALRDGALALDDSMTDDRMTRFVYTVV